MIFLGILEQKWQDIHIHKIFWEQNLFKNWKNLNFGLKKKNLVMKLSIYIFFPCNFTINLHVQIMAIFLPIVFPELEIFLITE